MHENYAISVVIFLGFLFSIIIHECAHAVVALWCGDTTARDLGRITLNPLPHIDPIMSVALPLVLFSVGAPIFGGANPVPVVPHNMRDPRRDMIFVAWAGPISNIILAILFSIAGNVVLAVQEFDDQLASDVYRALFTIVAINVYLACFNLLPIPPLDGSKILAGILPPELGQRIMSIPSFTGFAIIMLLLLIKTPQGSLMYLLLSPVFDAVQWIWDTFTFF